MKIEQNTFNNASTGATTGYVDLARSLSALNGKSITQTKRKDGKYKPLGFLFRLRVFSGSVVVETANCGYPTRNAVVLAGHARDEMLKSAGVSRGNLESYQKELRLKFECDQTDALTWMPGALDVGAEEDPAGTGYTNAYGQALTYDYTSLTFDDPDNPGTDVNQTLVLMGGRPSGSVGSETCVPVIYNWHEWRHSFTPSDAADDIAANVFSYAMQQSSTADAIIDKVQDEADEKPYRLNDFTERTMITTASTTVGNPITDVICAPLGLIKLSADASSAWSIEVVGVTEL